MDSRRRGLVGLWAGQLWLQRPPSALMDLPAPTYPRVPFVVRRPGPGVKSEGPVLGCHPPSPRLCCRDPVWIPRTPVGSNSAVGMPMPSSVVLLLLYSRPGVLFLFADVAPQSKCCSRAQRSPGSTCRFPDSPSHGDADLKQLGESLLLFLLNAKIKPSSNLFRRLRSEKLGLESLFHLKTKTKHQTLGFRSEIGTGLYLCEDGPLS